MFRRYILILAAALFTSGAVHVNAESVGLVLSGGGAKGIAHIGVIQALEDNDIPIDYIAGTSMGSIVGGLYAAGYTPAEMMELILSRDFSYWSTGRIDENLVYYFARNEETPVMLSVPVSLRKNNSVTKYPGSLISPLPMNFAFMDLFAAYTAQCDGNFDNLFVPFRCVTSDVKNKHKIVLKGGHLSDAIRASMSFPVVFQPIEIDSVLCYDGGIYDNFPVDVMREEFAPAIMIGVDVHGETEPANARDLINQVEEMVIQNNDYSLPADEGIKLRINLNQFSLLDFPAAKQIYKIGYDHAMAMMDSIKTRVKARCTQESRTLRRQVFKSATPYVHFDSVTVEGGTPDQNHYIKYLFTHNSTDTFGIKQARYSYYRAVTPGKLKDLHPHANYNKETGLFNLNLQADVKNDFTVGIGGYLTSSVNSMAFLTARYASLSLKTFDAAINGWIGQSYMAGAVDARFMLPSHLPTALSLQGVISRRRYYESDRLFFDSNVPTFINSMEGFGRLRYGIALGRSAKFTIEGGGGSMIERFYPNSASLHDGVRRDKTRYDVGQARLAFDASTLDNTTAPTSGYYLHAVGMWNTGSNTFTPGDPTQPVKQRHVQWAQGEIQFKAYKRTGRHFSIGGEFNALYADRKLYDNYNANIVTASAFTPTPASDNSFNPAFRANSYITIGAVPVWMINENLQLRGHFHLFQPMRQILRDSETGMGYYGDWFAKRYVYTELAASYNLRFATLSLYANYLSYPARNWNAGISFGLYFLAPKLLR